MIYQSLVTDLPAVSDLMAEMGDRTRKKASPGLGLEGRPRRGGRLRRGQALRDASSEGFAGVNAGLSFGQ